MEFLINLFHLQFYMDNLELRTSKEFTKEFLVSLENELYILILSLIAFQTKYEN